MLLLSCALIRIKQACIMWCCLQFIALGTDDGTVRLLDHSGTVLKDREYNVVS